MILATIKISTRFAILASWKRSSMNSECCLIYRKNKTFRVLSKHITAKVNNFRIYDGWIFDRLWKSYLSDKMKWDFSQAVAVSILLYRCTTWKLMKRVEKRLDENYTTCCFDQIQEATLHKTAVLRPPATTLTNQLKPFGLVCFGFMAYQLLQVI